GPSQKDLEYQPLSLTRLAYPSCHPSCPFCAVISSHRPLCASFQRLPPKASHHAPFCPKDLCGFPACIAHSSTGRVPLPWEKRGPCNRCVAMPSTYRSRSCLVQH